MLIRRDDAEGVSRGGIIIPDCSQDKQSKGQVLAVGPGRRSDIGAHIPVEGLQPGDHVLYAKFAGDVFRVEDDELILVDEKDVLAVVRGGEPDGEPE